MLFALLLSCWWTMPQILFFPLEKSAAWKLFLMAIVAMAFYYFALVCVGGRVKLENYFNVFVMAFGAAWVGTLLLLARWSGAEENNFQVFPLAGEQQQQQVNMLHVVVMETFENSLLLWPHRTQAFHSIHDWCCSSRPFLPDWDMVNCFDNRSPGILMTFSRPKLPLN